jgi:hypothetical protein
MQSLAHPGAGLARGGFSQFFLACAPLRGWKNSCDPAAHSCNPRLLGCALNFASKVAIHAALQHKEKNNGKQQ